MIHCHFGAFYCHAGPGSLLAHIAGMAAALLVAAVASVVFAVNARHRSE
jgi:hypothetical protein